MRVSSVHWCQLSHTQVSDCHFANVYVSLVIKSFYCILLKDNPDTLQHCSEQVVAHLVNFVSNFAGELC